MWRLRIIFEYDLWEVSDIVERWKKEGKVTTWKLGFKVGLIDGWRGTEACVC